MGGAFAPVAAGLLVMQLQCQPGWLQQISADGCVHVGMPCIALRLSYVVEKGLCCAGTSLSGLPCTVAGMNALAGAVCWCARH